MGYEILTKESVVLYLLQNKEMQDFFVTNNTNDITAEEIGDGNLNLVFLVSHKENKKRSLIVKQALPYLRCVGEDFPLNKERMHYEIKALKKFAEYSPTYIPKVYYSDLEMCVVVIQYLDSHVIMRKGMIKTTVYPKFADHLSSILANMLFHTSSLCLESTEKNKLISEFNSNDLSKLTQKFVFTYPYMDHPTNKIKPEMLETAQTLWKDMEFKKNILLLKDIFMTKTDALIHGDLHTGSIMLNHDETYLIDPEFSFVGPFGFDLGAVVGNLVMSWVSHFERSKDREYQYWILETIYNFLTQFEDKFIKLWNQHLTNPLVEKDFLSAEEIIEYQQTFMKKILQETIGFAGCKIARRQLGIAGVEDIRGIADVNAAVRAEKLALTIAREFVVNHQKYNHVYEVIETLKKCASNHYQLLINSTYHTIPIQGISPNSKPTQLFTLFSKSEENEYKEVFDKKVNLNS